MKDALIKLLKSLGWTDTQIAALKVEMDKDAPDEAAVMALKPEVETTITNLVMADPAKVKTIRDDQFAKALTDVESKVKKEFGLTFEETKDKKLEEIITIAKAKSVEGVTKDKRDLLEENVALKTENKKLKEEDLPAEKKRIDQHIEQIELEQLLIADLGNTEKRKLVVSVKGALPGIKAELDKRGLTLKKKDKGYEILVKETGMPFKDDAANKLLNTDEIIDMLATDLDYLQVSTPAPGGKKEIDTGKEKKDDNNKTINDNLGLSEAEKNLAEIKATQAANKKP